MKFKHFGLSLLIIFLCTAVCRAQVTNVKEAYKAIVGITTYDAQNRTLRTGVGTFIASDGTCVSSYALFKGAARAIVTDSKGKTYEVRRILGANSIYDLTKFSTTDVKKAPYLRLTPTLPLVGDRLAAFPMGTTKKTSPFDALITQIEDFDVYKYFHIAAPHIDSTFVGAPLLGTDGSLVAFIQTPDTSADSVAYAMDAHAATDLKVDEKAAFNADLRAILIPKQLPDDQRNALTYIYMLSSADSLTRLTAINDFIAAHPRNAEGYVARAGFFAEKKNYVRSEADFMAALPLGTDTASTMTTDAVHNEWSKAIFQKAVYDTATSTSTWTLDRAYDEAEAAYAAKPLPYYLLQQGRCRFAEKKYGEAYSKFLQLAQTGHHLDASWSGLPEAESWFYAARSLELSGGDSLHVIALMDSCVAKCPRPLTPSTVQYVFERALRLLRAGNARRAVLDYNTYEETVGTLNLGSKFFYIREQAELACRMYQQALDDIRTAIARTPNEPAYRVEEGIVLLRAGLFKEAVSLCTQLLKNTLPDNADLYKIMGIAHGELGQKVAAREALLKAKELGDPTASSYLEHYK